MTQKGQILIARLARVASLLILILIFILLFYTIPKTSDTKYAIGLQDKQITKGQNVILFLKITNTDTVIDKAILSYELVNTNVRGTFNIGSIKSGDTYFNSIELRTGTLDRGTYTVQTNLVITTSKGIYGSPLSLEIDIY
jgi:hypothetical protein